MVLGVATITQLVTLLAVFVVSIVLSTLTQKQAFIAGNRRECYKTLLGGKLMIGLIVVAAYLFLYGIVNFAISASTEGSSYAHAYNYIKQYISNGYGSADAYLQALLILCSPIYELTAYFYLLIAAIFGLIAGKNGKKPFIIISCIFTVLFLLEYASVSSVYAYNYIDLGLQYSNIGMNEQYTAIAFLSGCFYLIASVFLLVSTITFAIKIKDCVTTKKPVFKGITSVGILLGIAILPTVIAFFSFLITLIFGLTSGSLDSKRLVTYAITLFATLLTGLAITKPIMTVLRTGSNFVDNEPDEVPQNNEEGKVEPSDAESQDKPIEPVVQPEVAPVAPVVSAPVPQPQSIAVPSIIWKEKKDANGNPIDAQAKPIEQFSTSRGFAKWFFLSILTLGIYGLVVMCKVTKELGKCREGHGKDKPFPYFAVLILTPFTCGILPLVWGHKFARRLEEECKYRGIDSPIHPWQFWVFSILLSEMLFIFPFIYQAKIFAASNAINAHHNKYGDKMIKVVPKAPQPQITEPLKPIEEEVSLQPIDDSPELIKLREACEEYKPDVEFTDDALLLFVPAYQKSGKLAGMIAFKNIIFKKIVKWAHENSVSVITPKEVKIVYPDIKIAEDSVSATTVEETTPAPAPQPEPVEQPKTDPMEKLKKAKAMLDAGLITQEEYDEVKAKALSEL